MRTLKCLCDAQGLLTIGQYYYTNPDGEIPPYMASLANYEFKSANELLVVASTYDHVKRPNGKIEKGQYYTIRKAKKDFDEFSAEQFF